MKKITIALLAIAGFALFSADVPTANAQGIHIGTRGFHLDIGRPHSYHRGHIQHRAYVPRYNYYRPAPRPHYDYYPRRVVPHGNHLDVIPGHYRLHYGRHHVPQRGSRYYGYGSRYRY